MKLRGDGPNSFTLSNPSTGASFQVVPAASTLLEGIPVAATPSAGVFPDDVGFDIIILAGQSNMQGSGTPYSTLSDPPHSQVFQYAASGSSAGQIVQANEPLQMPSLGAGIGPGLAFGRLYAASVPQNRRVLLVPTAVGGTPLVPTTGTTWNSSVSNSLYAQMVSLAQAALVAAGPNSRFVACLWVQGENDAINAVTTTQYGNALDALVSKLRYDLNLPDLPFICGQMVPDQLPRIFQSRTEINGVHAGISSRLTKTAFAPGPFGAYHSDGLHYTSSGQRLLARSLFDAWRRIQNNQTDPPLPATLAQPTGVTVTSNVTGTYVVSWTAVPGASAYYIERSSTLNGTYSGGGTTTQTSATVTRLTSGTSEYVRVRAMNTAGGGTASLAVLASVAADNSAPTTPGTPTATAGAASATLTFTASTDNVGVTGYRAYASSDAFALPVATGTSSPLNVPNLTPAAAVSFRVTAVDAAGNESAKSGTSNAVTPTGFFVNDTFTDTAGKLLTAHTPEVGGGWGSIGWTYTNNFKITPTGLVYPSASDNALNFATPPSANYTVSCDMMWQDPVPSLQWGSLFSRAKTSTNGFFTFMELRWIRNQSGYTLEIQAYRNIQGGQGANVRLAFATLTPVLGRWYNLAISFIGTSVTAFVDGVQVLSATDTQITDAGFAGFGASAWTPDGSGGGLYFDNFKAG